MEKFIEKTLKDAGKILRDKFGKVTISHTKSHALDIVTEADLLSEKLIINRIKKKFPDHAILAEESGEYNKNKSKWIIDPLDGTSNFYLGIPLFVAQLVYVENNVMRYAGIYHPIQDRFYFAAKGKGAYLNHKRIFVSQNKNFPFSHGAAEAGFNDEGIKVYNNFHRTVKERVFWTRNLGASGVSGSLVASGSLDWTLQQSANVWDYAPVALLVEEAGGVVKNFSGTKWKFTDKSIVAGNSTLVKRLIEVINLK